MTTRYIVRHGRRIAIKTIETGIKPKQRQADPFVKVPLRWAAKAAKATKTPKALVWVWLLHTSWKTKRTTFPFPNGKLKGDGVARFTKHRALQELEAAGLITVERRHGKTPIVTLVN
jgi:hypothetical protein